ncbi:lantibiotic dehydratase C-terminal domain-containing protein [Bailinhaonella thermotolerans]|uniref:Thiopeptide-type bacteriocin biosynthesis domain-containing protein n=1 Tax=Bailinhaonella thermotolerans TaxID=1070861 RepID=A0A3A4AES4_9ACTN|nr:lantibiotic dehydratase C-terminal domain-containing protein [Bailinhaonella thermotolerans]RJL24153.1 hypothetical protein D5H75_30355 [Bailinhaonella thermotolerans]
MSPRTAAPRSGWRSARVFYYEPDKDDLLLDAVRPVMRRVAGDVHAAHVLRHWSEGPHLRLNIRSDQETWDELVRPAIEETVGGYLRDHPSLERLEAGEDWQPDNTIVYEPAARRHPADEALLADFYSDTTEPLFAMLDHVRHGLDTKDGLALALILAVSHGVSGPITRNLDSFRTLAEAYCARSEDPETTRTRFEEEYRARCGELTSRVSRVIQSLEGGDRLPFVREWAALMTGYGERAAKLMAKGKAVAVAVADEPESPQLSELNRLMMTADPDHDEATASPDFLRYRTLLNFTHLQFARLGLLPADTFRLCHLTANAVEELYGR